MSKRATNLDTLAQLTPTSHTATYKDKLSKRARAKYFTNELVMLLVDTQTSVKMKKSYWHSFHCCNTIEQRGQVLTSKYCNARWCNVCNRIRIAKLINGYHEEIKQFEQPYFVTLTAPNVAASDLSQEIVNYQETIRKIQKALTKKGTPIIGIRKLECTYNPRRNDYHPHFHFIVKNKSHASLLQETWLENMQEAVESAQDMRVANDTSIIELFKYFTKLVFKHTCPTDNTEKYTIFPEALNNIFIAMRDKRVYQPMGIKKRVSEDIEQLSAETYDFLTDKIDTWFYDRACADWISESDGEALTGYSPSESLTRLLQTVSR